MRSRVCSTLTLSIALSCFAISANAGTYTKAYAFTGSPDGSNPNGNIVAYSGKFFFTTAFGGVNSKGAVISYDPATGTEAVLHSFGTGSDGQTPSAGLTLVGSTLYGTTVAGGDSGNGTVFEINPQLGSEAVLYSFLGGTDGSGPLGNLSFANNYLFGTTNSGGKLNLGTVFRVDAVSGTEKVLHSFGDSLGSNPFTGLASLGTYLYGTTYSGGSGSVGTVYKVSTASGSVRLVHSFTLTEGGYTQSDLVAVGTHLYGANLTGGAYGWGTIYKLTPGTGVVQVLYNFSASLAPRDVYAPFTSYNGLLYGTSLNGGKYGYGTVFSVSPSSGFVKTLYSLTGGPTGGPTRGYLAPLLLAGSTLWGTQTGNGVDDFGSLFSYTP